MKAKRTNPCGKFSFNLTKEQASAMREHRAKREMGQRRDERKR
jgi:hypothetical protein